MRHINHFSGASRGWRPPAVVIDRTPKMARTRSEQAVSKMLRLDLEPLVERVLLSFQP
jgi:hypothetical protein